MSQALAHPVSLVPVTAKRGYDEIYYAQRQGSRFGIVRVNSPFKDHREKPKPDDPVEPLTACERVQREWNAYQRLHGLGLSPKPLWKTEDAMACSWLPWERVSQIFIGSRRQFWRMMPRILPAIRAMHDQQITHLDLNLGNLLADPETHRIAFIDFEFGPANWLGVPQQKQYDYLRLIDDCLKPRRGARQLLGDVDQLVALLQQSVDEETRGAAGGLTLKRLKRLKQNRSLCTQLGQVFPELSVEARC